jgi:hypothetical protein
LHSLRKLACAAPGWGSCGDPLKEPHPQPLPARGRGGDRVHGASMHQAHAHEFYRKDGDALYPGLFATPASAKVAIPV